MNYITFALLYVIVYFQYNIHISVKQAFDSIVGNTVVPYRSLKKFFNYHKLLFIAIYN